MKNHMWKMIMRCLCICTIVLLNAGVARAESIVDNAELASFGGSYRCDRGDEKAYKLVVTQSGIVTVNVTSTEMDYLKFKMCDSATNALDGKITREDLNSVTGILRYKRSFYLTQGTYYFDVYTTNSSVSDIKFNVSFAFTAASESFPNSNADDMLGGANELTIGQTYAGMVGATDHVDFFKVTIPSAGKLNWNIEGDGLLYKVYLYTPEGTALWHDSYVNVNSVTNRSTSNHTFNLRAGTYYYSIERIDETSGTYQVTTSFTSANESFADTGADDTIYGANPIAIGATYNGQIAALLSDNDYYSFAVETGKTYVLNFAAEFGEYCYIYDGTGDRKLYEGTYSNSATGREEISKEFSLPAGTYYLRIGAREVSGNYSFSIIEKPMRQIVKPGKVRLKKVKSTKKRKIKIQWRAVAGAEGYQVEAKKVGSRSKLVGESKSTAAIAYGLSRKKRYRVRVRAYVTQDDGSRLYGAWSKKKTVRVK